MRKTIPQYTIFTCDCCGREQDGRAYQEYLASGSRENCMSDPICCFPVKYRKHNAAAASLEEEFSIEVCPECAQRIHEAIEAVKTRAYAENVQEQLAMCERRKS